MCRLRGKQRRIGEVFVGDKVEFSFSGKSGNIEKVLPRTNCLTRPYVANVDVAFIVVASEPEPDYLLVDKLIVTCFDRGVEPIIVVNKADLCDTALQKVKNEYGEHFEIYVVSALEGSGTKEIIDKIKGKTVCFCGQSAVGKTTLMNALTGLDENTGGLSKIKRGRNTTRHVESYPLLGGFIVDTCGFSLLDIEGIKAEELGLYYPEFEDCRADCKFSTCTHIAEPVCGVKSALSKGLISQGRYDRYKILFDEIKNGRDKNEKN
ncbi:MAG: ribosome small subunit-dependent GTPase A [Clostridia bacterium]|nr:ribosome small subunit-dependent GTPase A [Clostridia bacterium]